MIRNLYHSVPGPAFVRVLVLIVAGVVGMIGLFFVFEVAGDLLDNGGAIGP